MVPLVSGTVQLSEFVGIHAARNLLSPKVVAVLGKPEQSHIAAQDSLLDFSCEPQWRDAGYQLDVRRKLF